MLIYLHKVNDLKLNCLKQFLSIYILYIYYICLHICIYIYIYIDKKQNNFENPMNFAKRFHTVHCFICGNYIILCNKFLYFHFLKNFIKIIHNTTYIYIYMFMHMFSMLFNYSLLLLKFVYYYIKSLHCLYYLLREKIKEKFDNYIKNKNF